MGVLTSQSLWAKRHELSSAQAQAMTDGKTDEARIIEGQIQMLDETLDHVIKAENEMRTEASATPARKLSFGEKILGARNEFAGIAPGFKAEASVLHVGSPEEYDFELPAKQPQLISNFASTLLETPAIGAVNYKQRGQQVGSVASWGGVTGGADAASATKAKVIYTYVDAKANDETIAGYVPVSKESLRDYDTLLDIIQNDLLLDLDEKTNDLYVNGTNSNGIIGIAKTPGIQVVTDGFGKQYYDAVRIMRTKVIKNSRHMPTHVAMSPEIKQAIDLYKDQNGFYQNLGDNIYWGLQVVEDPAIDGILVYDSFAARRRSIGNTTVEIGYANDQFIRNELSVLAEHTKALQVTYPDAFCFASTANLDKATA